MAKYYPKWAALLTALPLISFISLIWVYWENKDYELLRVYSRDILLWTLPSLFFFLALIFLLKTKLPFFLILGLATVSLGLAVWVMEKFHWVK